MDALCSSPSRTECSTRIVCRCLQITEEAVVRAVSTLHLKTVRDICKQTGAGDGCTCCHQALNEILREHRV